MVADSRRELTLALVNTDYGPILSLEMPGKWRIDEWEERRTEMLGAFEKVI